MKVQIRRAQDWEHYIVSIWVTEGAYFEIIIDKEDYRLLKKQIEILDEKGAER